MFLLQGITQFCDDKNKEDFPSGITNNSGTCHVQNLLTPAVLLQTAAVILEIPDTKQQVKVKDFFFLAQAPKELTSRKEFENFSTSVLKLSRMLILVLLEIPRPYQNLLTAFYL